MEKTTVEVKSLRILATVIFKTLTCINLNCMKHIFKPKVSSRAKLWHHDIMVQHFIKTTRYGKKTENL